MSTDDHARRLQELIEQIDALPDARAREMMQDCLQAALALHGIGLDRILKLVSSNPSMRDALVNDELVRGLLLIHGLHPVSLEARLQQALDKVLPYIHSHGGDLQLISLNDGVATLRLQGACKTCPSSAVTLELAVKAAINEFCPDLPRLEIEGQAAPTGPVLECVKA